MCAMFFRLKKEPGKNEKIVTRKVGVKDKTGNAYITCSWSLDFNGQRVTIAFSRDNMLVYVNNEPIETEVMLKDSDYDMHVWWKTEHGSFYIYSDVDVTKKSKPMINYLWINENLVSAKDYKEHKTKEKVPAPPRSAMDIYLRECQEEQKTD